MQITANDIKLEYEEYGPKDGPCMILVRGLGSQLVHWPDEFVHGFAELGYRTLIFDNRDVGLSQRCPRRDVPGDAATIIARAKSGKPLNAAYTVADMGADITGLMDALQIPQAHVLGISLGAAVTVEIENTNRLSSAILIMSAWPDRLSTDDIQQLVAYPAGLVEAQNNWLKVHSEWGSPGFPADDDFIRFQAATAWHRGHDAAGVNRQLLALLNAPDRTDKMRSFDVTTLVIHGADDNLIPADVGKKIAGLIPKAKLQIVQGMGHVITPKLAPLIVQMVDAFIRPK